MKIAFISDIHANKQALSVFEKYKIENNIDKVYCVGDICQKSANAHWCIAKVRDMCEVTLLGNTDNILVNHSFDLDTMSEYDKKWYDWNMAQLSENDIAFLRSLPFSYEFYLSGRLVRLFHSTNKSVDGVVTQYEQPIKLYDLFLPTENTMSDKVADVIVCAHTHEQYLTKVYNRTIINIGSVGNSLSLIRDEKLDASVDNIACVSFLVMTGEFNSLDRNNEFSYEFVNLPYNIDLELNDNNGNFQRDLLENELRNGRYRFQPNLDKYYDLHGIKLKRR